MYSKTDGIGTPNELRGKKKSVSPILTLYLNKQVTLSLRRDVVEDDSLLPRHEQLVLGSDSSFVVDVT